ncbi:alpha/beta hydrolase [Parafrankia discariae]|uniref:alpha/beta hydrolase n=1 Tax=Parafrankia discariae TaxID=365528 RepID=UPI00037C8358|nr:alpha/beta hydrolase-fold protein [Parafrankia discariae]
MPPSRRALLVLAASAVGGGLAGCSTGPAGSAAPVSAVSPGSPASPPASVPPAAGPTAGAALTAGPVEVARLSFASAARGRQVGLVVIAPGGARDGLPACLVLHGRGDDAERSVSLLNLDRHLADALAAGVAPFALVAVDGGEAYWHRRASGDDPERMIIGEVLPRLAGLGLRTTRLAATGWSMGGYGALLLARRHPGLVVAVAASSPAMWPSYGASAPGAFDSRADFAAHPVLGTAPVPGVSYRIDCGSADPFFTVSRQAARDLEAGERNFGPGGHTAEYWRSVAPAQLAFLGGALGRRA